MRKALSIAFALALAVAIVGAQDQGGPGGGKGPGGFGGGKGPGGGGFKGGGPGGGKGGGKGKGGINLAAPLKITVEGASDMGSFPAANAGNGKPSPAINWTGAPMGTQSFLLLMHDPDPVMGGNNVDVTHWLVYNIPGTATGLPAGVAAGALADGTQQAANMGGQNAYMGPGPPAGNGPHHYTIELYALNAKLDAPAGADRNALMGMLGGKVLAKGVFVATFENK